MDILLIGGTKFVGRSIAEAALERGHNVTLFHRGQTNPDIFPEAEHLYGNRDGDMTALRGREWDAVVDTSGYVPRIVRLSAELLADQTDQYAFISTGSVYADPQPGTDESAPLEELRGDVTEEVTNETYGGLKVLCENVVREVYPDNHLIVRPGIIAGPYDPTDRFTYWVMRIAQGGEVLAPEPKDQPVQVIDAWDLADWLVGMIEQGETGTYNTVGPAEPITMQDMLETIREAVGSEATFTWASVDFLRHEGVGGGELPFWMLGEESTGGFQTDSSKAREHGLTLRPIAETARDTLAWAEQRPADHEWRSGLRPDQEGQLLALWHEDH